MVHAVVPEQEFAEKKYLLVLVVLSEPPALVMIKMFQKKRHFLAFVVFVAADTEGLVLAAEQTALGGAATAVVRRV
ncbi:MAG: hypothetical protein UY61_C0027G0001, partial [Candidatus Adlerbacteria bacterium GW2011_GWC1_50_9]